MIGWELFPDGRLCLFYSNTGRKEILALVANRRTIYTDLRLLCKESKIKVAFENRRKKHDR